MEEPTGDSHEKEPVWPYALAAWLLASTLLRPPTPSPTEEELRSHTPAGALAPRETDPDRMNARQLRLLPGIGPTRALAIARARWERGLKGGPAAWDEIQGIGPGTVGAIQEALSAERTGR